MTEQTLLIKNADFLCTMAMPYSHEVAAQTEIKGGGLFAKNGIIETVGTSDMLPDSADIVLDLTGHIVIPGMVNTHHHLFQNLTRAVQPAQNAPLFGWLQTLYPIWRHIGPTKSSLLAEIVSVMHLRTAHARLQRLRCAGSRHRVHRAPSPRKDCMRSIVRVCYHACLTLWPAGSS